MFPPHAGAVRLIFSVDFPYWRVAALHHCRLRNALPDQNSRSDSGELRSSSCREHGVLWQAFDRFGAGLLSLKKGNGNGREEITAVATVIVGRTHLISGHAHQKSSPAVASSSSCRNYLRWRRTAKVILMVGFGWPADVARPRRNPFVASPTTYEITYYVHTRRHCALLY